MPLRPLAVVGLNHRTASLREREAVAFDANMLPDALAEIHHLGAEQAVLLSTCNRTEVYAVAPHAAHLQRFFLRGGHIAEETLPRLLYVRHGLPAARQLFRVASGLDSQLLGESEILGQVKRAWVAARDDGATGSLLDHVFEHALLVGKRVRAETGLGRQVVSIGSLALRMALETTPDIGNAVVLMLGTGEMATRIVKEMDGHPRRKLLVVSHTLPFAEALAAQGAGIPLAIGQMGDALHEADIVFTATAAPHPIIEYQAMAAMTESRGGRPMAVFDLGVPRNTEPEVGELPWITLRDLDDLKACSEQHRRSREGEIPAAEAIIEEELIALQDWCQKRGVAPLIATLKERAEEIKVRQLCWAYGKLGDLTDKQRDVIDKLASRLVRQLLHSPIDEIRGAAGEDASLAVLARILGLECPQPHGRSSEPPPDA